LINRASNFNQRLDNWRSRCGANTNKIVMKIETFRKYRNYLKSLLRGMEFIGKGFKDPNKLCKRLNLLVAAKQAGNNYQRLSREIANILKQLKSSKCISNCEHQKLCTNILK